MAHQQRPATAGRLRRLREELEETGYELTPGDPHDDLVLAEVDLALRPPVHERRVASFGVIVEPRSPDEAWEAGTELVIIRGVINQAVDDARRFADGLSSWLIRRADGPDEWCVFDRPAGSERDLVVLGRVMAASIVQRHPTGAVRLVGPHGVLRWDGLSWRLEPPIEGLVASLRATGRDRSDLSVLHALLEFAVHDLGSRGIGATLVYHPDEERVATIEHRLPPPPPLQIRRPTALAPMTHALRQVDGAAVFDGGGVLRQLGVRLVPSPESIDQVDGFRGMRHTSGRRYSYDDPAATVIVVSEDGPVTVLRAGEVLGTSSGGQVA